MGDRCYLKGLREERISELLRLGATSPERVNSAECKELIVRYELDHEMVSTRNRVKLVHELPTPSREREKFWMERLTAVQKAIFQLSLANRFQNLSKLEIAFVLRSNLEYKFTQLEGREQGLSKTFDTKLKEIQLDIVRITEERHALLLQRLEYWKRLNVAKQRLKDELELYEPVSLASLAEDSRFCPICQEEITSETNEDGEVIQSEIPAQVSPCRHYFGKTCINTWLKTIMKRGAAVVPTCSICRSSLDSKGNQDKIEELKTEISTLREFLLHNETEDSIVLNYVKGRPPNS